jgi:NitT/TauT family transport system permease protein
MSLIGVVIGEFITSDKGLGFLILYAGSHSNTPLMMAAIVVLCLAGLAIYGAVVLAERLTRSRLS